MKPHLVVIAGPNGSGKTTLALEYLKAYSYPYVSADAIVESMDSASLEEVRFDAGRAFFERVATHIDGGASFVVESTLSGLTFRSVMERAHQAGFQITIVFVFLGSEMACVARIHERVRKGGHAVSEEDIRRRFSRSIRNFWGSYRFMADRWHLFYNGGAYFHEVALGEGTMVEVRDETLFALFLHLTEEVRQ
jgi:predicted ABC-type ATPase